MNDFKVPQIHSKDVLHAWHRFHLVTKSRFLSLFLSLSLAVSLKLNCYAFSHSPFLEKKEKKRLLLSLRILGTLHGVLSARGFVEFSFSFHRK